MRRRVMSPLDGMVLAALVAVNWLWFGALEPGGRPAGAEVVSVGGTTAAALAPPRRLEVAGPLGATVLELEPEGATIVASPCPRQLCVATGRITRAGEVVACLPNRVAVRLLGSPRASPGGLDAVAK